MAYKLYYVMFICSVTLTTFGNAKGFYCWMLSAKFQLRLRSIQVNTFWRRMSYYLYLRSRMPRAKRNPLSHKDLTVFQKSFDSGDLKLCFIRQDICGKIVVSVTTVVSPDIKSRLFLNFARYRTVIFGWVKWILQYFDLSITRLCSLLLS